MVSKKEFNEEIESWFNSRTIVSAVFIILLFAGVMGLNYKQTDELNHRFNEIEMKINSLETIENNCDKVNINYWYARGYNDGLKEGVNTCEYYRCDTLEEDLPEIKHSGMQAALVGLVIVLIIVALLMFAFRPRRD